MRGDTPFFPTTTAIEEKDVERLDVLPLCPMIFQEMIPKSYELRIIYIDGMFYTGKINTSNTMPGNTDWRTATAPDIAWEPYTLPETICECLTAMMREMGLFFRSPGHDPPPERIIHFSGSQSAGRMGHAARDLQYPIGETIAQKLIAGI